MSATSWPRGPISSGGLCGVVVGYGVLAVIKIAMPTTGIRAAFPPDTTIAMDTPVWLFALGLSILSGIAFGLAPAVGATRLTLTEAIKGDGSGVSAGRTQRRFRQMLVVSQTTYRAPPWGASSRADPTIWTRRSRPPTPMPTPNASYDRSRRSASTG